MNSIRTHIKNLVLNYLFDLLESDKENIYKNEILILAKKLKDL